MMFWYGGHWVFWQAFLMWAGMIVFWGLVIWAVYALITGLRRDGRRRGEAGDGGRGDDPRRILDQRLARGEIDEQEYQRLRRLIESRGHEPASAGPGAG